MSSTYMFIFMQINIFFTYERFFTRTRFETEAQGNLEMICRPFAGSAHMVRNTSCWDAITAVGLPKQGNSYQSSPTFLCFESPTALFASHRNLFLTTWPDPTKGLFKKWKGSLPWDARSAMEYLWQAWHTCVIQWS